MGTTERRGRERLLLRQRILAAAQEIINREGYSALSMRKLAERIEYSPAAIYLHFQSREEIARELAQAGCAQLWEALEAAAASGRQARTKLRSVARAYVGFAVAYPETYRLIFMADAEYMAAAFADQNPENPINRAFSLLVTLCADLKAKGLVAPGIAPKEAAEALWSAVHGVVSIRLTCTGFPHSSGDRMGNLAASALIAGLKAVRISARKGQVD